MSDQLQVLVVDDDRRMVKTICDILRIKGYGAVPAYSGEEAVENVKWESPACVLMDIKMPGIDGVGALKLIRNAVPNLPVLLMSAYATGVQVEEAKRQGAYAVLTKPIDVEGVLSFLSLLRKDENVLVMDDDPLFSKALKDKLQAKGYWGETEADAGKVLEHMESDYQLMVLLDLKLGDAKGTNILREIRERYPTKPVVMITGNREGMGGEIEKGFQMGAYSCLYKPFETEHLIGIIEEIRQMKIRAALGWI